MHITTEVILRHQYRVPQLDAVGCNHNTEVWSRRFRGNFGMMPDHAASLWNALDDMDPMSNSGWVYYFLMTLFFLRNYSVMEVMCLVWMRDEKTVKYWTWRFIEKLSFLDKVRSYVYDASSIILLRNNHSP